MKKREILCCLNVRLRLHHYGTGTENTEMALDCLWYEYYDTSEWGWRWHFVFLKLSWLFDVYDGIDANWCELKSIIDKSFPLFRKVRILIKYLIVLFILRQHSNVVNRGFLQVPEYHWLSDQKCALPLRKEFYHRQFQQTTGKMSGCPFNADQLVQLKAFISVCQAKPMLVHHPKLDFFKDFLESLGAVLPPAPTFSAKPSGDT